MARKASPTISQEELYPPSAPYARQELDDARLVDLDVDEESPFLRGQKRISARRSSLPKKTANRLIWASLAAALVCFATVAASAFYRYGERSWRFRVDSSDNIEITGTQNVTKGQIMEVMGGDMGRNVFFIPLAQQKAQLEQIPWVESASVMRFVPNRLKVEIHERTPVAFARVGPRISLIDASGALMELTPTKKYSFPVILGMNAGEPLSTRAPRMKVYNELARELDSGGAHYSQDLSEVDLSDLEDVKVRVNDPSGEVLVHLGASDYLRRYKIYVSHAREWRQQFDKLESVDLRYENQIIVNPDLEGTAKRAALSPAAARTAIAAGVKPAALISKFGPHDRVVPKPAFELPEGKWEAKPAGHKAAKKIWVRAKPRKAHRRTAKARASVANQPVPKGVAAPSLAKPAAGVARKPSPAIAKGQGSAGPGE
jgi:cell division protein FtsQ